MNFVIKFNGSVEPKRKQLVISAPSKIMAEKWAVKQAAYWEQKLNATIEDYNEESTDNSDLVS